MLADNQKPSFRVEQCVTAAEAALLCAVHYGITVEPSRLPSWAALDPYAIRGPAGVEECRTALEDCLAKGWLQVVDGEFLAQMKRRLQAAGFIGPIYRLPQIGEVDFTEAGAQIWRHLTWPPGQAFAFLDVVYRETAFFFYSRSVALAEMERIYDQDDGFVSMTIPTPIGPWGVQWWRRYASGVRIHVEQKWRWEGRAAGSDGTWRWDRPLPWVLSLAQLQRILDCHNIARSEWLVLAAMDHAALKCPGSLLRRLPDFASKQFGMAPSTGECQEGLEGCLRNGWLRIVDEDAALEVASLLQNAPSLHPFYDSRGIVLHELDFTPAGAVLYQMTAKEFLGPDWDAGIILEQECYRKEHRYCETEEGIEKARQDYLAHGENVLRTVVTPIGPWCVYWWERFASGYMMEVEIGEPQS